jgi:hypothetical protein
LCLNQAINVLSLSCFSRSLLFSFSMNIRLLLVLCTVYRSSQRYLLDCTLCTGEMRWLDERALDGDDAIGRRMVVSYLFQEEELENT